MLGIGPFKPKVDAVHTELHKWDREVLKRPKKRMAALKAELEDLRRDPAIDAAIGRQKEILLVIENLLEQEEMEWVQRGRANWLKHGDRNTNFFYMYASARRKKNTIKSLQDENGVVHEGQAEMANIIQAYFTNLFTSQVNIPNEEVIQKVVPKVSVQMNEALLAPFNEEDVRRALFSIGDFKAPGPDGLHAAFYKRF
ncbi:uncharacterized protein [Aegilops tauschii subsp. strangulata]|uniref:uncharacterized protein n=1 Tax=Aegilops tauschii subsp. strangulata TaxID=200361 RepID=UPI003CC8D26A